MPENSPVRPPVTIADVATHLGVSKSTVSVALRGKPGVSPAEAKRIRQAAEQLGYRQNPLMGIHMSHVRNSRQPRYQATLAWIDNHPKKLDPKSEDNSWFYEGLQGASTEAARLGFRLEEFRLQEPGITHTGISRILRARNISGLIIAPQPQPGCTLELEWEHFSVVAMGYSLQSPRFHIISNCQRHTLQEALLKLRSFGYRRIGTIINEEGNARVNNAWSCALWDDFHQQPVKYRLKPLLFHQRTAPLTPEKFIKWFEQEKPDAVIAEDFLPPVLNGLKVLGLREGVDVALAVRRTQPSDNRYAGMNQRGKDVGAAAVAFLAGMLQRNERGIPAIPQQLLLESFWQSGRSVREQPPR